MSIKPLADRVLIEPAPAETKTVGGISFPTPPRKNRCKVLSLQWVKVRKTKRWS